MNTAQPVRIPADNTYVRLAILSQVLLGIAVIPFVILRAYPGPATSLIPAFAVSEIITAYLLVGDGVRKRCPATLMLAGAFLSTVLAYNGAPAALKVLGFAPTTAIAAGALAANFLFPAWVLTYTCLESYCLSRQFSNAKFALRGAAILAASAIAPFVAAGTVAYVMYSKNTNETGWTVVALLFGAVTFITFSIRSAHSLTNLALRVSLFCLLADLLLVSISSADSLGFFGAECFALIAVTVVPFVYIFEFNGMYAQLAFERSAFKDQALRDALTGVGNRRGYEALMNARMQALHRGEISHLGLLVVDIDNFKSYNDVFGHEAGDRALVRVAEAIARSVARTDDAVFRYGGEEFAVVVTFREIDGLRYLAERIRNAVWNLAILHPSTPFGRVTVSLGAGVAEINASAIDLFNDADRALYASKRNGRNCATMQRVSSP
jgi:diguanylate cyclase (GGDEF)-like protein